MVSQKVIVKNASGIHARPAGVLAKEAMKCTSDIAILTGGKKVQAKSILSLMAAAIKVDTEIEVVCTGENEEEDLRKIVKLIEDGLGE